uniref:Uncharacterized protein n=1 Tax=Cacopsylla melanoneura TaxID=428564 RepID=A0A8D8PRM5_9HEMI
MIDLSSFIGIEGNKFFTSKLMSFALVGSFGTFFSFSIRHRLLLIEYFDLNFKSSGKTEMNSISSSNVISYYDYRIPFFPHVCMVKIVILLFHSFFPNAFAFDTGVSVFFFFFKGEKCSQEHHLKLEISKKEKT